MIKHIGLPGPIMFNVTVFSANGIGRFIVVLGGASDAVGSHFGACQLYIYIVSFSLQFHFWDTNSSAI